MFLGLFPVASGRILDRIRYMWDLVRIRKMLRLFRRFPRYNGPEWHIVSNTQEINWDTFSEFLLCETFFMEDWRYKLLRRFLPSIYQDLRSVHYKKICNNRMAKINHYIVKTIKYNLFQSIRGTPHATRNDTRLKLTPDGVDFIDNPTDFLRVLLREYGTVVSFLKT